jgi:hypothetical protein
MSCSENKYQIYGHTQKITVILKIISVIFNSVHDPEGGGGERRIRFPSKVPPGQTSIIVDRVTRLLSPWGEC